MKPGTLVADRYRCLRLLGRGGMGEVHAAVDLRTDRRVALKLLLGHRLDQPDARARFAREAKVGARIDSPHLVEVQDAGVDADDTPFLVMELLDGEDLEHRLARLGPRPPAEVLDHLAQVALALDRMHAARVVHRDLKPSNLFLQDRRHEPPRIKVLDLGVAKELTDSSHTTGIAGTPLYMAPEQIAGAPVSPATDLHALGLIAFTLLTATSYWTRLPDEEPIAFAVRMKDGPTTPASTLAASRAVVLPPAFDAWFTRATARRPAHRFPSAASAIHALAAALALPAPAFLPAVTNDLTTADPAPAEPAGEPPDTGTLTADPVTSTAAGEQSTVLARPSPAAPPPRDATASPPPPTASPRSRRWLAAPLALVSLGAIATWRLWPAPAPTSPLAEPGAVLACVILEVDGEVAANGWLGAAAASLACERARALLGGSTTSTLLPAELLHLNDLPIDSFPIDPYADATARARSLVSARTASAYLDGRVRRTGEGFQVELSLRRPDGSGLARGLGVHVALHEAVRDAMTPLVSPRAIPIASALDPTVADHAGVSDVASLLDNLDLDLAFKNNAGQLPQRCREFADRNDGKTDREQWSRHECNYTLGRASEKLVPFTGTSTTAGAQARRARIRHMFFEPQEPGVVERLEQFYRTEQSPWSQSLLATTLACLVEDDRELAKTWGERAIRAGAKNPTGAWCAPWEQITSLDRSALIVRAMQAWEPWNPYAWKHDRDDRTLATYAARAFELSPLDTVIATHQVDRLLAEGLPDEAREAAQRLSTSGEPVHVLALASLSARIAASQTKFGAALALSRAAMQPGPDDAGWIESTRLEVAAFALDVARVLGGERELADDAIARLVDPAAIERESPERAHWLVSICMYASPAPAERCFAALDKLVPASDVPDPARAAVVGARRFAAGDPRGAAVAWRIAIDDVATSGLIEAMVVAFEAIGDRAAVARLLARADDRRFNDVSMAMARAAIAAHARGEAPEATRLAKRVIEAWAGADTEPPIVAQLRTVAP